MRTLTIIAACAALAGCGSDRERAPEMAETDEPGLGQTAIGDMTGTYEVRLADGSLTFQVIHPDGSYVETDPDGREIGRGAWRAGENGTMCFDPAGDEVEECYAGGAPGPDGSFTIRDSGGGIGYTVRKVEPDAALQRDPGAD